MKKLVYIPELFHYIGTAVVILTDCLCIYSSFIESSLLGVCFTSVFGILGLTLIIFCANCFIEYSEDGFTQKTFWGNKRHFTYEQITAAKGLNSADAYISISVRGRHRVYATLKSTSDTSKELTPVVIYADKKRIRIDETACGKEIFIKHIKKKYRQLHNGNRIPEIPKKNRKQIDIFNGNLKEPNQIIFAFIIMTVISCILSIVLFFMAKSKQITFDDGLIMTIGPAVFIIILTAIWIIVGRYAHKINRRIVRIFYKDEHLNIK